MNKEQMMVRNFMCMFNHDIREKPGIPTATERSLGRNLNTEEFWEMLSGMGYLFQTSEEESWATTQPNLVEFADGAIDLLYVIYWVLNSWGIDAEELFKEVHKANMNKSWTSAQIKRLFIADKPEFVCVSSRVKGRWLVKRVSDGKIIKPPGFKHPDIGALLAKQMKNKTKKGKKK
jgi:hypothetical protein